MGHSMGGAIVTLHAITRKPAVAGMILSGAALQVDAPGVQVAGVKVIAALSGDGAIFNLDLDDFSRDDPNVYQGGAPARTAAELIDAVGVIGDRMAEVRAPLLILHGGADKVTPPAGSRALHQKAASTDKTIKIYDGLYHDILHEPERERVIADIAAWVAQRTPR
jgi:alpha-beta hydrolase superfamily lysophospholipase